MDTIKVTDFAEFWKGTVNGETRYYATRDAGMGFDPAATKVKGFAVYDTTVAGSYAIELYSTKEQAQAHKPAVPQEAPTSALPEDDEAVDEQPIGEMADLHESTTKDDEKPSKTARRGATKKRGR